MKFIETSSYGWVNPLYVQRVFVDYDGSGNGTDRCPIYGVYIVVGNEKFVVEFFGSKVRAYKKVCEILDEVENCIKFSMGFNSEIPRVTRLCTCDL